LRPFLLAKFVPISYAILLDGGFIRRKLGSSKKPADAETVIRFVTSVQRLPCVARMRLHRIYLYDANPIEGDATIPLGGGKINFGASDVAARNKRMQAALKREPFFALRFGELVHDGWNLRPKILKKAGPKVEITSADIKPNIRQKAVDMRIGLDIAMLTIKRHVKAIVLVTGDSDFIPAMKCARREGAQLFLVTMGHGVKATMHEHADLVIAQFPLP
jgi:uncharacterized LabA/DUF88 family protein